MRIVWAPVIEWLLLLLGTFLPAVIAIPITSGENVTTTTVLANSTTLAQIFRICTSKCKHCDGVTVYRLGSQKPASPLHSPALGNTTYTCLEGYNAKVPIADLKEYGEGRLSTYRLRLTPDNANTTKDENGPTKRRRRSPQSLFPALAILNQIKEISNSSNSNHSQTQTESPQPSLPAPVEGMSLQEQGKVQWNGLTSALAEAQKESEQHNLLSTTSATQTTSGVEGMTTTKPQPALEVSIDQTTRKLVLPDTTPTGINDEGQIVNSTSTLPPDTVLVNDDTLAVDAAPTQIASVTEMDIGTETSVTNLTQSSLDDPQELSIEEQGKDEVGASGTEPFFKHTASTLTPPPELEVTSTVTVSSEELFSSTLPEFIESTIWGFDLATSEISTSDRVPPSSVSVEMEILTDTTIVPRPDDFTKEQLEENSNLFMSTSGPNLNLSPIPDSVVPYPEDGCEFEDIEKYRRNIITATFGYNLDSEPSLFSFVDGSPCVAVFSKSGSRSKIISIRSIWPQLSLSKIEVASYADGCIYFILGPKQDEDPSMEQVQVRSFQYDMVTKRYNESTVPGETTLHGFLRKVCGIEIGSNSKQVPLKVSAFLKLPDTSTCLVFNESGGRPLVSPNATETVRSLGAAIGTLLEAEFLDHVDAAFVWEDVPLRRLSDVLVFGSNGEMYKLSRPPIVGMEPRNPNTGTGTVPAQPGEVKATGEPWQYSAVPYEKFP